MGSQAAEIYTLSEHRPIVKADIEKGYTRIANELTEALMVNNAKLSGREFQIVQAIIHKTFRFHKKSDWISNSQISEMTGIAQSKISELKTSLKNKKVIIVDGKSLAINTTVSEWQDYPKKGKAEITRKGVKGYPNMGNGLPENGEKLTRKGVTHKKDTYTKENTTKDICPEQGSSEQQGKIFLKLPLNKKNTFYSVTEDEVLEKIEIYPAVDVRSEYRKMSDWLKSNPRKRKTAQGIKAFATNWLSRRQDKPASDGYNPANPSRPTNGFDGGFDK